MSITRAFDEALDRSKKDLPDKEKADFAVASMQDVYNEAEKIQKKQSDKRSLRNMRRIEPYLKGLAQFSAVIEVFVQAKPEIMAFIWVGNPKFSTFYVRCKLMANPMPYFRAQQNSCFRYAHISIR